MLDLLRAALVRPAALLAALSRGRARGADGTDGTDAADGTDDTEAVDGTDETGGTGAGLLSWRTGDDPRSFDLRVLCEALSPATLLAALTAVCLERYGAATGQRTISERRPFASSGAGRPRVHAAPKARRPSLFPS